jgi:hypothetical protein
VFRAFREDKELQVLRAPRVHRELQVHREQQVHKEPKVFRAFREDKELQVHKELKELKVFREYKAHQARIFLTSHSPEMQIYGLHTKNSLKDLRQQAQHSLTRFTIKSLQGNPLSLEF